MKKSLAIDGQVFQTPAWHRGMGKYSYELISAICDLNKKNNHWDSLKLVLSNRLKLDEDAKQILNSIPRLEVVYLDLKPNEFDNRPVASFNRQNCIKIFRRNSS